MKQIVRITTVLGKEYELNQIPEGMDGYEVRKIEYMMLGQMDLNRIGDGGWYRITVANVMNENETLLISVNCEKAVEVMYKEVEEEQKSCETPRSLKRAE